MSRYTIPSTEPGHHVDVGWDRPLSTFFGQVFATANKGRDEEGNVLLWVGTSPAELTSVDALAKAIAAFAELPRGIKVQLSADRLGDLDRGPTILQRTLLGRINRKNAM